MMTLKMSMTNLEVKIQRISLNFLATRYPILNYAEFCLVYYEDIWDIA